VSFLVRLEKNDTLWMLERIEHDIVAKKWMDALILGTKKSPS